MGLFDWLVSQFKGAAADLPSKALAELKSKAAQFFTDIDSELSKDGKTAKLKLLETERGWSAHDVECAKKCIADFKDLKRGVEVDGKKRYDFIFIRKTTEQTSLDKYDKLADELAALRTATVTPVFKTTVTQVVSYLRAFNESCQGAIHELGDFGTRASFSADDLDKTYNEILSNLTRKATGTALKIRKLLTRYICQKRITSAADVAKFYFAVCSISSKKDSDIGFIGRGISNTLLYIQEQLRKKYDELLNKEKKRRSAAAAAAAAAAADD